MVKLRLKRCGRKQQIERIQFQLFSNQKEKLLELVKLFRSKVYHAGINRSYDSLIEKKGEKKGHVAAILEMINYRRRNGRDLRKVGFYDPINNQTYLNVPAILYFLEKGAQPTATVHDILKKAGVFTELSLNQTKFN
ncbi:hypothetical protein E1A91_D04G105000v1 [Gossypium mustelinum]|uniref:30S ribosomal protein S16, chloroplastic n=1 Tax=Gossypium mustelinum TaxID=34275 RepID=A0A5D2VC67_GOSMU|nr:hypothetical protein E1A91_D04G105000v1 [Gossypium mustelinum]